MKPAYHRSMTEQALGRHFTPSALAEVIRANLGQDALYFQIGHDHFHYDNNAFAAGDTYIKEQRHLAIAALQVHRHPSLARAAFGRLLHAAQDFYSHSNYITIWREFFPGVAPEEIYPELDGPLNDPRLQSGRLYYPLEALSFLSLLKPVIVPLLPRDSHAWMNMDDPSRPDFDYAVSAATHRTEKEYQRIIQHLATEQVDLFTGRVQ